MPKSNKQTTITPTKEEKVVLPAIFENKTNAPSIKIAPEELLPILEYFGTGGEFEVIPMICKDGALHIYSRNKTANCIGEYKGTPNSLKIEEEGFFILETKKIINIISRKYKDSEMLSLSWPKGGKITFQDEEGNPVKITPFEVGKLKLPKEFQLCTFDDDGRLIFKKKDGGKVVMEDGEPVLVQSASHLHINQSELLRGANDMDVTNDDYIIYHFDDGEGYCETGTWGKKGDTSRTDNLELTKWDGEMYEIAFPKVAIAYIKELNGTIDIQGENDMLRVVISKWMDGEEVHFIVSENKRVE